MNHIANLTPSLSLSNFNKTTPQLYLRGIGSNTSGAADDASVALFVDDVYLGRAGAYDSELFAIERVEVIKGPQGTLYGKNATGGAVHIIPRKPSATADAQLQATLGSDQREIVNAYVNQPLARPWLWNFSTESRRRDGYVENTVTGKRHQDEDRLALRTQLMHARAKASTRLSVDAARDRVNGPGPVLTGAPLAGLGNNDYRNEYDKTMLQRDGYTNRDDYGVSLHQQWQQPTQQWQAIVSARSLRYSFLNNLVPTDAGIIYNSAQEQNRQWSAELRWRADYRAGDWLAGLYAFRQNTERWESYDERGYFDLILGPGSGDALDTDIHFAADNTTTSYAGYGEMHHDITTGLSIIIGGRYSWEQKDFTVGTSGNDPLGLVLTEAYPPVSVEQHWDAWTGRAIVQYTREHATTYLSFSQGFKSGAFNSLADSAAAAQSSVDPEWAQQWEWGTKIRWWEQRAQLQLAVFAIDYDDLQVFQIRPDELGTQVNNAATATSRGAEVSVELHPTSYLTITGNYAYLDAHYDSYRSGPISYAGQQLLRAPKHQYSLTIAPHHRLGETGQLHYRINWFYQSQLYYTAINTPAAANPPHHVINASISWLPFRANWALQLWGKNLTDERYNVFQLDLSQLGSPAQLTLPAAPRSWGVTASYQW